MYFQWAHDRVYRDAEALWHLSGDMKCLIRLANQTLKLFKTFYPSFIYYEVGFILFDLVFLFIYSEKISSLIFIYRFNLS